MSDIYFIFITRLSTTVELFNLFTFRHLHVAPFACEVWTNTCPTVVTCCGAVTEGSCAWARGSWPHANPVCAWTAGMRLRKWRECITGMNVTLWGFHTQLSNVLISRIQSFLPVCQFAPVGGSVALTGDLLSLFLFYLFFFCFFFFFKSHFN